MSAATFGTSGAFSKSLMATGWSPAGVVLVRLALAGVVLGVVVAPRMVGRWHLLRTHAWLVVAYGTIACAGCQLFYCLAIERMSVGVALLIEYLAPVLLVLLAWARTRRAPGMLTALGVLLSLLGLVCVLDLGGEQRLSLPGLAFALGAAVSLAAYFLIGAHGEGAEVEALPPLVLAAGGMVVGAASVALLGILQVVPVQVSDDRVPLLGGMVPWWAPALFLGVVPGALAYASGVAGARLLGSTLASFVGLTEVLFAVLCAWLMLHEVPGPPQALGGLLILGGVAAVRLAELRAHPGQASRSDGP